MKVSAVSYLLAIGCPAAGCLREFMGGHDKQIDKRLSFLKEQAEISCTLGTGSQRQ
jgi:hypothetical protein|uniref:hypothetical protein n=1 Tax=Orrella sp. TaxID=1921583 RepID=UPI0040483D03